MLKKSQIAVLAVGGSLTLAIGAFYVIKDKTSHWLPKPLHCQEFPTTDKRHPGKVEICINGVHHEYSRDNGDAELHITFMRGPITRVQAEGVFWLADKIGEQSVDYTGEINWHLVKIYDNNVLVSKDETRRSAYIDPVVPKDVHIPMWKWTRSIRDAFDREILGLEDKFDIFAAKFIEILSMLGTAGVTIYKFFHATGG